MGEILRRRTGIGQGDRMSSGHHFGGFAILIVGILIAGLAVAAHLAHMPMRWIVVCMIVMIGIGAFSAAKAARPRDAAR
jgi:hypothetical protein